MTGRLAPFIVHVAGVPGDDHLQRCVPCGVTLTDNRAWFEGNVAVMDGDDRGPSWWPAGALVATDKEPGSHQAAVTYVVETGAPLDDDERPCVTTT